ncbi:hypothetical protein CMV_003356 [Castanea mollissima]|uniref:Uncharacterized protein n=1 Tax=Castanea mollissima TaxID=60419 RepID=A0A8J4RS86_9ROSI|nr:hypothetical protein CMV_003356 [Castanea mollissima]
MSSFLKSPYFTDLFLPLYPEFVEDSSTLAASPDDLSLILSLAHDLPVLDPMAPWSPEPLVGPDLRRFTRKRTQAEGLLGSNPNTPAVPSSGYNSDDPYDR